MSFNSVHQILFDHFIDIDYESIEITHYVNS